MKYEGKGLLYTDAAAIQSNKPFEFNAETINYFEVKVNHIGQRGDLSIGITDENFPQNKLPGMTKYSIGYKSDGKLYVAKKSIPDVFLPLIGINHLFLSISYSFFIYYSLFTC